jgi:hypothetical protein
MTLFRQWVSAHPGSHNPERMEFLNEEEDLMSLDRPPVSKNHMPIKMPSGEVECSDGHSTVATEHSSHPRLTEMTYLNERLTLAMLSQLAVLIPIFVTILVAFASFHNWAAICTISELVWTHIQLS